MFEDQVERKGDERHEHQGEGVAQKPVQLGHVVEVHPVDRPYQRWREQDGGPGGDLFYLLVLGQARQGEVHAEDALQQLTKTGEPFRNLQDMVAYVAQVPAYLGVDVDAPIPHQIPEHAAKRLRGPLEFDHLARELVDPARHAGIAPEDLSLYLLDVILEAVDHGSVVVHDAVHDSVQDRLWSSAQVFGVGLEPHAYFAKVRGLAEAHGNHEVVSHEDMDFTELDPLLLIQVTGRLENDEENPAVALQLGPLVGLRRVLDRQPVQVELVCDGREFLFRRFVEADPGDPVPLPDDFIGLLQGVGLGGAMAVDVDGIVHDHSRIIRLCRLLPVRLRAVCKVAR